MTRRGQSRPSSRAAAEPTTSSSRWLPFAVVALAIATIVAFAPALRAPLIFDDPLVFLQNPTLDRLWPPSVALTPPAHSPVAGRPVANYSFALNYAVNALLGADQRPDAGLAFSTFGFHIGNLLLHLLCGMLILGIVRRTLRAQQYDAWWAAHADAGAFAVVALWLLHPIQTEAVDYLAQRTELLVSVCYAGTLYASIRACSAASMGTRRGWIAAALAACLLGMGSKEVMISAPIIVILYDRAFRFPSWRALITGPRTGYYVALLATMGVLLALVAALPRATTVGFHLGIPWYRYLYTQAWAILHYLHLVAWPAPLTLDYGVKPITGWIGVPGLILLTACGVVTVLAWMHAARWGWLGFLGAWFFLLLGPSSSVVPIVTEVAAERRVYLADAAVFVLVMLAVEAARRYLARKPGTIAEAGDSNMWMTPALLALICIPLAIVTFNRSQLFADPIALWGELVDQHSANPRVYDNLAVAMLRRDRTQEDTAVQLWRRSVAVDSGYAAGWYKLGLVAFSHRQFESAQADFSRAVAIDSDDASALERLGDVLVARGQTADGIADLQRVATHNPTDTALVDLGNAYLAAGRVADAERSFESSVALYPDDPVAMTALGDVKAREGDRAAAEQLYRRAVQVAPDYAPARARLAFPHGPP